MEKDNGAEEDEEDGNNRNNQKPMTVWFSLHVIDKKEEILSKSPYFRVEVSILFGRELIAMDRGGTSDAYVQIMRGEEQFHKTVTSCELHQSQEVTLHLGDAEDEDLIR